MPGEQRPSERLQVWHDDCRCEMVFEHPAESLMAQFDRRDWLKLIGLVTGGAVAAPRLFAKPEKTAALPPGASDKRLVRLSLNENPYGPAPSVLAAVQREFGDFCRYSGVEVGRLLTAISTKEAIPEEHIILGEILEPLGTHLSLQGGAGGEFIYSDPGYTALIDAASAVGGVGIPVPLNLKMQNDLPAIAAKVNQRTRAVFLVNPHNPTGTVMDTDELKQFVRDVSSHALVIVDEAYLEFTDDFPRRTLTALVRAGENVIVFRTFAKMYGLAGLDIGYGLLPKPIAQTLKKQGLDNPHLFNRLAVAAATASLAETHYVSTVASRVAHERKIWLELLRGLNVNVTASNGNFVFFETGIPHTDFAATLLKDGIDVGRSFPPYDLWARISIGLPQENARARTAVQKLLANRPRTALAI
jgi:histidinol-phosphate aminotransferase